MSGKLLESNSIQKFRCEKIITLNKEILKDFKNRPAYKRLRQLREEKFVYKPKKQKAGKAPQPREEESGWTQRYYPQDKANKILQSVSDELGDEYKKIEGFLARSAELALVIDKIESAEDFTFYLRGEDGTDKEKLCNVKEFFVGSRPNLSTKPDGQPDELSYDCTIWLWDKQGRAARGRALACPSHEGKRWSITFRKIDEFPKLERPKEYFLNDADAKEICDELYPVIFSESHAEEHGLIIIAGRTGTAKSKIARGLLNTYLKEQLKKSGKKKGVRRPHLLTFEDPIEKYLADTPLDEALDQNETVDYTPREKGKDAVNVKEAVMNALRQTPKVLFVGETREAEDWSRLLDFAGTGHLVITTTHAGSLVEAMANLLRAVEARRPTRRSEVADRTLALIHLRRDEVVLGKGKKVQIIIPALWHRTPTGVKALMAEGLSSLLPNTPNEGEEKQCSSIGRRWFAKKLVEHNKETQLKSKVIGKAFAWDLEGI